MKRVNWEILCTRVVEAGCTTIIAHVRDNFKGYYPGAQIRTFTRTVKAGGAQVLVVVIVARKEISK